MQHLHANTYILHHVYTQLSCICIYMYIYIYIIICMVSVLLKIHVNCRAGGIYLCVETSEELEEVGGTMGCWQLCCGEKPTKYWKTWFLLDYFCWVLNKQSIDIPTNIQSSEVPILLVGVINIFQYWNSRKMPLDFLQYPTLITNTIQHMY